MAEGGNDWDFDCPQFYDFCDGVEDNTVNIGSLGGDSPALENKFNLKLKHLMKNKFGTLSNKNNYLTISTPINKSPFVNIDRQANTTDSEKLNEKKKRFSRSEGCVNAIGAPGNIFKAEESYCPGFTRKRSVSDSDIRPKKKYPVTPKKIPATPMCLKRTQRRDRTKKIKTTEELELEKIAQLQSLTLKHLRLNEKTMRKLKLNPKSSTVPKPIPLKDEKKDKSAPVKQFQKDLDDVAKRLNSNKNMRITVLNQAKRSQRLGPVSNVFHIELPSASRTLQPPATNLLDEVQDTADEDSVLDELGFKNPGHSGVFFHMNKSKNAALKPFNFHDRVKVSGPSLLSKSSVKVNKENAQVPKVQFSHSFHVSNLGNRNNNKENVCMKTAPKSAGVIKKTFKF